MALAENRSTLGRAEGRDLEAPVLVYVTASAQDAFSSWVQQASRRKTALECPVADRRSFVAPAPIRRGLRIGMRGTPAGPTPPSSPGFPGRSSSKDLACRPKDRYAKDCVSLGGMPSGKLLRRSTSG